MSKEINVEQLFLESNNYPLIIETIIYSMIQDKLIDFKISLLVINKIIDILDNYKIELDDKVIVELISLNGYFIQIINYLSGERIRQIENRALRKIRSSKSLKKVDDYALKPGKI